MSAGPTRSAAARAGRDPSRRDTLPACLPLLVAFRDPIGMQTRSGLRRAIARDRRGPEASGRPRVQWPGPCLRGRDIIRGLARPANKTDLMRRVVGTFIQKLGI